MRERDIGKKAGKLSRKRVLKHLRERLCMLWKEGNNTQSGIEFSLSDFFEVFMWTYDHHPHLTPPWLQPLCCWDASILCLFSLCVPLISCTLWSRDRSHRGPLFVSRLAGDIWTLFSVAQFPVVFKRDKGEQAPDRPESHSPSCWAPATWHGHNDVEGEEATEVQVSKTEFSPSPKGVVCVNNSPWIRPRPWATRGSSRARLRRSGCETTAA